MAEPTPEELRLIAITNNVMNDQLQPVQDDPTTNASRLHLAQANIAADLLLITTTKRVDTFAHVSSSANSTGGSTSTLSSTSIPSRTNLSSALGISHSSRYQAGGIKWQTQNPVEPSPTSTLTAQELRNEAMDLRHRANQDYEKVMDTFGEARVTTEGIRNFLHAWDIYSKNVGIVKTIFQRFGLISLDILAEIHNNDPPPTTDGTLFREYLDRKYCDAKTLPLQIIDTFRPIKMPTKDLTVDIAESYLAEFLTAKLPLSDRITPDPDIQATLVLAFYNGIRPITLLKKLKELPTTTLKATITRFQLITASEAEISLINIKEAAARKNTDRQFDRHNIDRSQQNAYVRERKKALAATVVEQQPPPKKRHTLKKLSNKFETKLEKFNNSDDSVRKPALIDSGCSGMYTPIQSDLDPNSFVQHTRHDRKERIEDASGAVLKSTGKGTIAGKPAYLVPGLTDTLLSAHVICQPTCTREKDDNFLLTTSEVVYCIDRNIRTDKILDSLQTHVKTNPDDLKFIAQQENGVYSINTDDIKQLTHNHHNDCVTALTLKQQRKHAKRIRRYETTQFKSLAELVLYWHENFGC